MLSTDIYPDVSVVVPIYNVENYLEECVRSILEQSKRNIEIILVDDATPDRSGAMADVLADEDARIRVIHRSENGGLGPARNSGIEVARGKYIMFVDSDDWIDPGMIESLYRYSDLNRLDICSSGRRTVIRGKAVKELEHPFAGKNVEGSDKERVRMGLYGALPERIVDSLIPVSAWAALYKRSFIEKHSLRFINIRSEDMVFNIRAYALAEKIGFCPGVFYNYRKDDQPSITNTVTEKSVMAFFELFAKLEDLAKSEPPEVRYECVLRSSRRIIDLSRGALGKVFCSGIETKEQIRLAKKILNNKMLHNAIAEYPIWKVPLGQAVYSLCMKYRLISFCMLLSRARRRCG